MFLKIATITFLLIPPTIAAADDYRSKANAGYELYKNGEYDKAVENYRQAGIVAPEKALPNLGKGAAQYRMNNFDGAGQEFSLAADKGEGKVRADALYNIGNSLYRAGNYQGALKSYVEALKINPGDKDYKHNLELALLRQQKQQQQQQQRQEDKNEDQEKQDQQKSEDSREDREQEDQKPDQKQQEREPEKKDQQERSQGQSADEQRMSEEEARNLLARFEQDDKEVQEKLRRFDIGRSGGRDW